jgi:hypothetical protein
MIPNGTPLAGRLQAELADMEQIVARAKRLLDKASRLGDTDYLDGVALNLHGFYAGAERIFIEIAKDVDGAVPTGGGWHRSLLMQMSVELNNIRPAVIQHDTRNCLDEYRSFRHVVRNVYTFNLRPSRLQELVEALPECYQTLLNEVNLFCDFLHRRDEK